MPGSSEPVLSPFQALTDTPNALMNKADMVLMQSALCQIYTQVLGSFKVLLSGGTSDEDLKIKLYASWVCWAFHGFFETGSSWRCASALGQAASKVGKEWDGASYTKLVGLLVAIMKRHGGNAVLGLLHGLNQAGLASMVFLWQEFDATTDPAVVFRCLWLEEALKQSDWTLAEQMAETLVASGEATTMAVYPVAVARAVHARRSRAGDYPMLLKLLGDAQGIQVPTYIQGCTPEWFADCRAEYQRVLEHLG
jgi:hypothetical protein